MKKIFQHNEQGSSLEFMLRWAWHACGFRREGIVFALEGLQALRIYFEALSL
jgi:hypothetical protein